MAATVTAQEEVAGLDRVLMRLAMTEDENLEKARMRSLDGLFMHCVCSTAACPCRGKGSTEQSMM
eukprot:352205-Chlamydomonas_euryale.AAC.2